MIDAVILRADRFLTAILDAIVVFLAGLLLLLLNYAVFARFVLNQSVSWGEELPAYLLASLTFIGAAYLTRTNEHIGFDGVVRLMPQAVRAIMLGASLLLMTAFSVVMAWYGSIAAFSFGSRSLISIGSLPMGLFRAAVPVGCTLIAVICLVRFAGLMTGRIKADDLLPETDA